MRARGQRCGDLHVGACVPLLLLLFLLLAAAGGLSGARASTVLYAFDSAVPQVITSASDQEIADLVAMHSLRSASDDSLFALDRDAETDDIVVRVGGYGCGQSDGVSFQQPHDAPGGQKIISFSPAQIDFGQTDTCVPTLHTVEARNLATRPVRIDDVRLESDAFVLTSDPRGVELEPDQALSLSIIFVGSQPEQVRSLVVLVTSHGEFALPVYGQSQLGAFGLRGLRVAMPVGARLEHAIHMQNPSESLVRVNEVFSPDGVGDVLLPLEQYPLKIPEASALWEMPAHSAKPIARFVFKADVPVGRYRSSVHVVTASQEYVVPIEIDVRGNDLLIEPSQIDLGVFTNAHEQREVVLTFHNTGSRPVVLLEVHVISSYGLDAVANLLGDTLMVLPRSRMHRAVQLVIRDSGGNYKAGPRHLQLRFTTDSAYVDASHTVHLHGFAMRGHISYALSDTTNRVVAPSATGSTTVSTSSDDSIVEMGASSPRMVTLKNDFDVSLELNRVSFAPSCKDFTVQQFERGVAQPSAAFPPIWLHVRPDPELPVHARACFLQVETNMSVHNVPIVLYTGLSTIAGSRNTTQRMFPMEPSALCEEAVDASADTSLKFADDHHLPSRGSKVCRQLVMDLGEVARFGVLEEAVNITNTGPTDLKATVQPITESTKPPFVIKALVSFMPDPQLPVELAVLGAAWSRSQNLKMKTDNQTIAIVPGSLLSLRLRIKFKTKRGGRFLVRLATVETDFETIQVLARFEAVKGTIKPANFTIEVPNIHPGRVGFVDVPFVSTIGHDVSSRALVLADSGVSGRNDAFGLWQLPSALAANSTSYVRLFYFSAAFYGNCRRGRFFADCFVSDKSLQPPHTDFSDFGCFVTAHDLEKLAIREREWDCPSESDQRDCRRRIGMSVALSTEAVLTKPVQIDAMVSRPQFFSVAAVRFGLEFPLTELLKQDFTHVSVANPSDYTVDMELAISAEDRDLFYSCDDDMTEDECIREWQDIAREQAERNRTNQLSRFATFPPPVAPFFFKQRVFQVDGRDQVQVGPIFFFPSTVGIWNTRLFLRNDLTHIEPIPVVASSGKGEISIAFSHQPANDRRELISRVRSGDGVSKVVVFTLDADDDGTLAVSGLTKAMQITNTGSFRLGLSAQLLEGNTDAFQFDLADTNGRSSARSLAGVVLEPRETLSLSIAFRADCFHSRHQAVVEIASQDDTMSYVLVGKVTTHAAFLCRRALLTPLAREMLKYLWFTVSIFATLTGAFALWHLVRPMNDSSAASLELHASIPSMYPTGKTSPTVEGGEMVVGRDDVHKLIQDLPRLENAMETAPASEVVAPTVNRLLASRRSRIERRELSPNLCDDFSAQQDLLKEEAVTTRDPEVEKSRQQQLAEKTTMQEPKDTRTRANMSLPPQPQDNQQEMVGVEEGLQDKEASLKTDVLLSTKPEVDNHASTALPLRVDAADWEENSSSANQDDDETDETVFSAPEEDDDELDNAILVVSAVDPFARMPRFDDQRRDELSLELSFDGGWNSMGFDSMQSVIGKLLVANDGAPEMTTSATMASPLPANQMEKISNAPPNRERVEVLNSLSIAPPLMPMTSLFALGTPPGPGLAAAQPRLQMPRAVPPGFTPADANPQSSRAAFERHVRAQTPSPSFARPLLQGFQKSGGIPTETNATTAAESGFSAPYSLFGPTLLDGTSFHPRATLPPPANGRIGGRRTIPTGSLSGSFPSDGLFGSLGGSSRLASLGGVELSPSDDKPLDYRA